MLRFACQGDFDVRWLRGSASELIFAPWLRAIQRDGGRVLGGKRVSNIRFKRTAPYTAPAKAEAVEAVEGVEGAGAENRRRAASGGRAETVRLETDDGEVFEADAVVLAVGITAAKVRLACC